MDEDEKLLKLLEIFNNRFVSFHNSLWESEKQFTWWILVIFGSIILAFNVMVPQKTILLLLLSLLGISVSLFGYFTIRKEGIYFVESKETYRLTVNALSITEDQGIIPGSGKDDATKKHALMQERNLNENYTKNGEYEEEANKSFFKLIDSFFMNIYFSLMTIPSMTGLSKKKRDNQIKREYNLHIRDYFQILYLIFAFVFFMLIFVY
jgi:hypothetical protein